MESVTHSPAPWREGPTDGIGQRGLLRVVDANGVQVADCEAPKRPDDPLAFVRPLTVDQANVRLVIAAPDLLAALKELVGACDEDASPGRYAEVSRALFGDARNAITKAEGR